MRATFWITAVLATLLSNAQMRPIERFYIVEGIVADIETLKTIPSAIFYNDSLKITTTSDENGYFKIVVPADLVSKGQSLRMQIQKTGYRMGLLVLSDHMAPRDSVRERNDKTVDWCGSPIFCLVPKSGSPLASSSGPYYEPKKQGFHGYPTAKIIFDQMVIEELRDRKFLDIKEGNDRVYFPLNSAAAGLATCSVDVMAIGKLTHVFINNKYVPVEEINRVAKRNEIIYDGKKSDELSVKSGKRIIALKTIPLSDTAKYKIPGLMPEVEIDLDQ